MGSNRLISFSDTVNHFLKYATIWKNRQLLNLFYTIYSNELQADRYISVFKAWLDHLFSTCQVPDIINIIFDYNGVWTSVLVGVSSVW